MNNMFSFTHKGHKVTSRNTKKIVEMQRIKRYKINTFTTYLSNKNFKKCETPNFSIFIPDIKKN